MFHRVRCLRGKVLVVGGEGVEGLLASAELYDPSTDTWSRTGSMTQERVEHAATLLADGGVLVVGGRGEARSVASAEVYDPASGTWSDVAPMSVPRSEYSAVLLQDGTVLVAGGARADREASRTGLIDTAEVYDPVNDVWAGPPAKKR